MAIETITIAASWAWDKLGKELLENLGDVSKKWTRGFTWKGASKAYRDKVRELYGEIRVFGSPRPTPLGDIFTDVYILDMPTAYRRFDLTEICSDPEMGALASGGCGSDHWQGTWTLGSTMCAM